MIVVCPTCGAENRIPDVSGPGERYRCGKCNTPLTYSPTNDDRPMASLVRNLRNVLPGDVPPRLLFFFYATFIHVLGLVSGEAYAETGRPVLLVFALVARILWFALVFVMLWPSADGFLQRYRKPLNIAALLVVAFLVLIAIVAVISISEDATDTATGKEPAERLSDYFTYNDATALLHQASEHLIEGVEPYSNSNIVTAIEEHYVYIRYLTPLRQGAFAEISPYPTEEQLEAALATAKASPEIPHSEFESKVSYPAGSFLFQTPFVALGLEDMRFFYLLCALIMLAVLFWLAPKGLRPVVAIAFLTNYILWHMVAGGLIDTLWVLLVFVGWISRRNPWLSALLMGLAAATKQMAWFFILFYLILSLRESGWKGTLRSLGVIAVTFTVVNVPFIFLAPHSWLEGVLAPILDPMFGQGDGIVALTIIGVLPPNQLAFTLIEAAVLLLALVWYYYNWREYPQAGLLLPVLPLFFAWRSLPHNFFFASLLVFGAVVIREYSGAKASAKPQLSPSTQLGGKPL